MYTYIYSILYYIIIYYIYISHHIAISSRFLAIENWPARASHCHALPCTAMHCLCEDVFLSAKGVFVFQFSDMSTPG